MVIINDVLTDSRGIKVLSICCGLSLGYASKVVIDGVSEVYRSLTHQYCAIITCVQATGTGIHTGHHEDGGHGSHHQVHHLSLSVAQAGVGQEGTAYNEGVEGREGAITR